MDLKDINLIGELKEIKIKALVSLDKSIRLIIDVTNYKEIDLNYLYSLLHKAIEINLKEYKD